MSFVWVCLQCVLRLFIAYLIYTLISFWADAEQKMTAQIDFYVWVIKVVFKMYNSRKYQNKIQEYW